MYTVYPLNLDVSGQETKGEPRKYTPPLLIFLLLWGYDALKLFSGQRMKDKIGLRL